MNVKQLKKLRKKLLALTVATSVSFGISGCDIKNDNSKKQNNNSKIEIETTNNKETINNKEINYNNETKYTDIKNKELINFLEYNNKVIPSYKNENLYISEEKIEELIKKSNNNKTCDYKYSNNINNIVSKIELNSKEFLLKNKEFDSIYKVFDSEYKMDFNNILKEVLEEIIKESTNNINEDICNMQTLRITITNNESMDILGYYNRDENMIAINLAAIEQETELSINHDLIAILKKTLRHEINHLRQYPCECRKNKGQVDEYFKHDDYISSLMEASAESEIYNIGKKHTENISKNDYSYYEERFGESLILMLALCQEDVVLEDYYNAIFDSNIKGLYNFVGAKTEDEIYELHKILYSIDAVNLRNNLGNYFLKETNNTISQGDLEYAIGYAYKVEIFKKVLENMATYTTKNSDFTLEENIIILNAVKNSVTIDSYIMKDINEKDNIVKYNCIYEDSFVKDIYNLENNYVYFLSKHYKCEIDEIREIEDSYITEVLTNINYISQGFEPAYYEYKDIANDICEKFPIITAIAYSNNSIQYGYSNFLKNNNLILVKNKENY